MPERMDFRIVGSIAVLAVAGCGRSEQPDSGNAQAGSGPGLSVSGSGSSAGTGSARAGTGGKDSAVGSGGARAGSGSSTAGAGGTGVLTCKEREASASQAIADALDSRGPRLRGRRRLLADLDRHRLPRRVRRTRRPRGQGHGRGRDRRAERRHLRDLRARRLQGDRTAVRTAATRRLRLRHVHRGRRLDTAATGRRYAGQQHAARTRLPRDRDQLGPRRRLRRVPRWLRARALPRLQRRAHGRRAIRALRRLARTRSARTQPSRPTT